MLSGPCVLIMSQYLDKQRGGTRRPSRGNHSSLTPLVVPIKHAKTARVRRNQGFRSPSHRAVWTTPLLFCSLPFLPCYAFIPKVDPRRTNSHDAHDLVLDQSAKDQEQLSRQWCGSGPLRSLPLHLDVTRMSFRYSLIVGLRFELPKMLL